MQDPPSNNLRVALYARVSTEEQREGQTIDSQVAELERFAKEKGWAIAGVYRDEGWSGAMLARPDLDRLRDDGSKGLFAAVLINDVDRLARDVAHLGVIKRDLERHGLQVIFRKLPTENSPTHNLLVNILGSFAEFERELIADRTRRGRRHKVEVRKQFIGSIPPYGFRYFKKDRAAGKEGTLEINPEEAAVVRQMYAWVDEEGFSARQVLRRLNQMRLPPRKGSTMWGKSSVLRILRSEIYAGVWYFNKFEACVPKNPGNTVKYKKSPKSSLRLRPRSEWLPVVLPESLRIVPRDQWQRVQRQLDRNIAFSPRNEKHAYLLKGLVRCGSCRARYVGQPCHGCFYYRCMARCKKVPSINEDRLNQTVWAAIEEAVLRPDLIADQVAKLKESRATNVGNAEVEATEADDVLLRIQQEETRVIEAYRLGIFSPAQLGQELEKISIRKTSLERRKVELLDLAHKVSLPQIRRSIVEYCRLAAQRLQAFTLQERQRFLRLLIRDIVFDGSTVRICGAIPIGVENPENRESTEMAGRIATTKIGDFGRNVPAGFSDLHGNFDGYRPAQYVPFELERPVSREPAGVRGR